MEPGGRNAVVAAYVGLLAALTAVLLLGRPVPALAGADLADLVALGLLVGAAEFLQVRFRQGREVDGSNLVESTIAPLIVLAPGLPAVLAVALGQVVAAAVRRNPPLKAGFNTAQWALATTVGSLVWTALPSQDVRTWGGAAGALLTVTCVSAVNLVAFVVVMALVRRESLLIAVRGVAPVFGGSILPGLALNALLGLLFVEALAAARGAVLLLPVPLVVLHLAFRVAAEGRADRTRLVGAQRAVRALSDPLDPREAVAGFLRLAAECFQTGAACLVLRTEAGREVHTLDLRTGEHRVGSQEDDEASLEAAVCAHLGPLRITADGPDALSQALAAAGRHDCLAAPLLDGGRSLGALLLLDQAGVEGSKVGELAVLGALGREAAGAFAKGRLLESVLEERRKLSTIVSSTSDGIASVREDGVVRSWNPALAALTGLPESAVVGVPDALGLLDARTPTGAPVDLAGWSAGLPLPSELSVASAAGGRRRLDCSYSHADDGTGRTLVLVARDVTPVQEFEALRAEFGRLVAQEAARRLVVEQLQAAVTPDTPVVEGLELAVAYVASDPKEPTGGDLWDWHVLPSGELHIAVVDVVGHGVAATKSALSVVHTLRAVALDDTPLEEVVERASALLEKQDPDLVATVVLARLHPVTGRLLVCSGGHPPAFVISRDGQVRQSTATGGALGWPGAGSDGVQELWLGETDALLLYTDGLVEARKDIVEGLDSLAREAASVAHLPVEQMTDQLVERALAGADRRDDTLALVVRRTLVPSVPAASVDDDRRRWQLAPERHAAQQARRDAVRWLAEHGVAAGDAALVVAELLSNAVRAARHGVVLELALDGDRIDVQVGDDGPGLTALPADVLPDLEGEGSRGLFLVRKISRDLEVDGTADGTTVRCWLPRETEGAEPEPGSAAPTVPDQPTGDDVLV